MNFKSFAIFMLSLCFVVTPVFSQDIDQLISKYTEENGPGYVQPLADAAGAVLNSGYYHDVQLNKNGFQLYLGVVTAFAFVPEKNTTFEAVTEGSFSPTQTAEVPTLFGSTESVEVEGIGETVYVFPGGLNVSMVPYAIPQLTIGSVFGTDATIRYFGVNLEEDIGKISLISWGLRHSVSQYFDGIPLDIALAFYESHFSLGDYIKSNSWIISAQAGKHISIFTFYGGLGYENNTMHIEYQDEEEEIDVDYELKGGNSIRLTAGVTFNLGPLKLNVDYNLASQSSLSAGIGLGFGEK